MKGYMMRVRVIVSSAFSPSNPGARTCTSHGAVMIPTIVIELSTMTVIVATLFASFHAALSPSVAMVLVNVVMNEVDRAPSANRSRRRLGMRKAIVKASMRRPPPKSAAKICSRARPSRRLHRTARPTIPAAFVFSFSAFAAGVEGEPGRVLALAAAPGVSLVVAPWVASAASPGVTLAAALGVALAVALGVALAAAPGVALAAAPGVALAAALGVALVVAPGTALASALGSTLAGPWLPAGGGLFPLGFSPLADGGRGG